MDLSPQPLQMLPVCVSDCGWIQSRQPVSIQIDINCSYSDPSSVHVLLDHWLHSRRTSPLVLSMRIKEAISAPYSLSLTELACLLPDVKRRREGTVD